MRNILVAIEHSLESSIALRTSGRFGSDVKIHPIYVPPSPYHKLSIGAGWARNTWVKETIKKARRDVRDLLVDPGRRSPEIIEPIVTTGEPVKKISDYFFSKNYDLLITGAPFQGMDSIVIADRFRDTLKRSSRDLPLLIVKHLNTIRNTLALTDGGDHAEKALGFLKRINPLISEKITLVGLKEKDLNRNSEALNLERGLAILRENEIDAEGYTEEFLGAEKLAEKIEKSDLLVLPFSSNICINKYKQFGKNLDSVLFYMCAT